MHCKKIIFTFLVAFGVLSGINAQQRYFDERSIYKQHFIYPVLVNPGAIGIDDHQQLILNYRNDYASFEGSPKSITLNYNGNVGNRLGFAGQLFSDTYGGFETTKGLLGVSYTIESPTNKLGFGLTTEYTQHVLSGSVINNDQIDPEDVLLFQRLDGNSFLDASFGVYGIYDGKLKYGVSFPSLISSKINSEDGNSGDRDLGYVAHFAYVTKTGDGDITLEPSAFIKSLNNIPTHVDINLKASFLEDRFTGALGYTVGASQGLGFLIGTRVDNLNLNYSYNISTREFQDYNNGSHEIGISFTFNKKDKNAVMTEKAADPMMEK